MCETAKFTVLRFPRVIVEKSSLNPYFIENDNSLCVHLSHSNVKASTLKSDHMA